MTATEREWRDEQEWIKDNVKTINVCVVFYLFEFITRFIYKLTKLKDQSKTKIIQTKHTYKWLLVDDECVGMISCNICCVVVVYDCDVVFLTNYFNVARSM